jgi:hypothetical protein
MTMPEGQGHVITRLRALRPAAALALLASHEIARRRAEEILERAVALYGVVRRSSESMLT